MLPPAKNGVDGVKLRAPLYLGTCQISPDIDIVPKHLPAYDDETGSQVPFDEVHDGEEGWVFGLFTRFNEETYERLADRPYKGFRALGRTINGRGIEYEGDGGTLIHQEDCGHQLWLRFPYADLPEYKAAGMPAGYRFAAANCIGPDRLRQIGTPARTIFLAWHCIRSYLKIAGDDTTDNRDDKGNVVPPLATYALLLYDHDMSGLPTPD